MGPGPGVNQRLMFFVHLRWVLYQMTFIQVTAVSLTNRNTPWERTHVPAYGNKCFGDGTDLWL